MKLPHSSAIGAAILSILTWSSAFPAQALDTKVRELQGRSTAIRADNEFGTSVAITNRWIVVGDPGHGERGIEAGAVHIYRATNGSYVRRVSGSDTEAGDQFGASIAVFGNLLLVGAPERDEAGFFSGAAYLFNLATGKQIAKLVSPTPAADDRFGAAVTLSDSLAVVGAPGADGGVADSGAIFVFDTKTGAILTYSTSAGLPNQPFQPLDSSANDEFGQSLSLCGNLIYVGAPGAASDAGKVYLFDVTTGVRIRTLTNPGGANAARFGETVSFNGGKVVIGAPNDDEIASMAGAAYLFNGTTGIQEFKFKDSAGQIGDTMGSSVSLSGNLALVGSQFAQGQQLGTGAAFLFDVTSGALLDTLMADNGESGDLFGSAAAIFGNAAVVGARGVDSATEGNDVGSAFFFRPVGGPLPLMTVAQTRASAPDTSGAFFRAFRETGINGDGETIFGAQLGGPDSGGGRDRGVWHSLGGPLSLAKKSRDDLSSLGGAFTNLRATTTLLPVMNVGNRAIFQTILAGSGVNATNNRAILQQVQGGSLTSVLRTGIAIPQLGDARIQSFREVLQTADHDSLKVSYLLRRGAGGVTAANDTGILTVNSSGAVTDFSAREGGSTGAGSGEFRQFFGRSAAGRTNFYTFGAFHLPSVSEPVEQGLFFDAVGGSRGAVMTQGDDAPGIPDVETVPGGQFRSFTGETNSTQGYSIFRATLTGLGVTRFSNEGLWKETASTIKLLYRRGDTIGTGPDPDGINGDDPIAQVDSPDIVVNRVLRFWPVGTDGSVVLVKLRGPGVNASNDCALFFNDSTQGIFVKLMREGDATGDSDGSKIRNIQRVDVYPDGDGHYVVLVSLTGPAGQNQALFTGAARFGFSNTQSALRLPNLKLRKGTFYDPGSSPANRLRSIVLRESTDRTGAGGKGLNHAINNNGKIIVNLQYTNLMRELAIGEP
ncbi:MAG: hypothetical protein KDN20_12885 [Verrucomicrobiae bacterium]|nr:hypothetical protein [Verrucomicrobiae bacterium]